MNSLALINTDDFNGISCNVYSDGNKIYMTRSQIGKALGYDAPNDSIRRIHERHSDRLDKYSIRVGQTDLPSNKLTYPPNSTTVNLTTAENDTYAYVYNQRGIMEICRWSRQPLADAFMDWVWNIIEAYRDGTLVVQQNNVPALTTEAIETMVDNRIQYITKALADEVQLLQGKVDEFMSHHEQKERATTSDTPDAISRQVTKILSECGFDNMKAMRKHFIAQARKNPEDIIRETIEPLAKSYNDHSLGYNCTYRKVYDKMNVSWKHRLGRYRNIHNNKNNPSKIKLIANDPKLLNMFVEVVNQLSAEREQQIT